MRHAMTQQPQPSPKPATNMPPTVVPPMPANRGAPNPSAPPPPAPKQTHLKVIAIAVWVINTSISSLAFVPFYYDSPERSFLYNLSEVTPKFDALIAGVSASAIATIITSVLVQFVLTFVTMWIQGSSNWRTREFLRSIGNAIAVYGLSVLTIGSDLPNRYEPIIFVALMMVASLLSNLTEEIWPAPPKK